MFLNFVIYKCSILSIVSVVRKVFLLAYTVFSIHMFSFEFQQIKVENVGYQIGGVTLNLIQIYPSIHVKVDGLVYSRLTSSFEFL